jgi:hypothetical protein
MRAEVKEDNGAHDQGETLPRLAELAPADAVVSVEHERRMCGSSALTGRVC